MVALRSFLTAGLLLLGSLPHVLADPPVIHHKSVKHSTKHTPPPPPPHPKTTTTSTKPAPTTSTKQHHTSHHAPHPKPPVLTTSTHSTSSHHKKHTHTHHKPTSINPTFAASNVPTFAANGTYNAASQALPVTPVISPALGLAGVLLIITGLAFAIIGVRRRRFFIFLSSTYLTALSIVVLIVYVANPPISAAVQGAYFAAAFVSGCIIGGLSLIFAEVTQGLACLLGGFCISMWFMVLKPGGLITSEGPRIAFIAACSAVAFALSFSHYTRDYALIGLIAFSGATAAVLGIDCFSLAGLKEFWIYTWQLNDKLFPLDTNTYPLTKGIKVEIAGILVLTFVGLLSQVKLWKILDEKRKQRKKAQMQDEEDREHLDTHVGRKLEAENAKELANWEMEYGNDKYGGSTLGSDTQSANNSRPASLKRPGSLREPNFGVPVVMEMTNMEGANRNSYASTMMRQNSKAEKASVTVKEVNYSEQGMREDYEYGSHPEMPSWPMRTESNRQHGAPGQNIPGQFQSQSLQPSSRPPPVVVPLPFKVPMNESDDTRSLATAGGTTGDPFDRVVASRRSVQRTKPPKSTADSHAHDFDDFDRDDSVPHVEDDRSSVAATMDEGNSDEESDGRSSRAGSRSPRRRDTYKSRASLRNSTMRRVGSASDVKISPRQYDEMPESERRGRRRRSSAATEAYLDEFYPEGEETAAFELAKTLDLSTLPKESRGSRISRGRSKRDSRSSLGSKYSAGGQPLTTKKKRALPGQLPKVAMYYRTNEWAKHLEAADVPDDEELNPTEDAVTITRHTHEVAAPVDMNEVQQTANTMHQRIPSKNSSVQNSSNPFRKFSFESQPMPPIQPTQKQPANSRPTSNAPSQGPKGNRRSLSNPHIGSSPASTSRSATQPALTTHPGGSSSNLFFAQPVVESPAEEAAAVGQNQPVANTGATLLHKREDLMRNKLTTTSLMRTQSSYGALGLSNTQNNASAPPLPITDSASMYNLQIHDDQSDNISLSSRRKQLIGEPADDDDMPLSQRRQVIQSQQHANYPYQRPQGATLSHTSLPRSAGSAALHDSHQPKRGPAVDPHTKQLQLANWREHLRQDLIGGPVQQLRQAADEGRRAAMLEERRQAQMAAQQREWETAVRDTVFDQRMRNGEMLDLHKDAMKRMQQKSSTTQ